MPLTKDDINLIKEGLKDQFDGINVRFDKIDHKFEEIDGKFEKIDRKFEKIDGKFAEIDRRFDIIDVKFSEIYIRFDVVDDKFASNDNEFGKIWTEMRLMRTNLEYQIKSGFRNQEERFDRITTDIIELTYNRHPTRDEFENLSGHVEEIDERVDRLEKTSKPNKP